MDSRAIGIFDSGVGGLTVLKEIRKELPNENIIYLGDTLNFPYGNKGREQIVKIAIENTEKLIKKDVKVIVIACGTATSQAIDVLKERFNIPIIGIIEPTVKYIKSKGYKEVGIMGTEGTIKSGVWENKLKEEIQDIKVINIACPKLAECAEKEKSNTFECKQTIREYVKIFNEKNVTKIILGCTHYPLIEELIRSELNNEVELINTGIYVAKELKMFLKENQLENLDKSRKIEKIYLSKEEKEFNKIAQNILRENLDIGLI